MALLVSQRDISIAYNIRFSEGRTGTAFCWADDFGTFLVTAKHILKGAAAGDRIEIRQRDRWQLLGVREISFAPDGVDICVFTTENFGITFQGEYDQTERTGVHLGQDVLFVGYPHGLVNDTPINGDFVTALVRKASFSGVIDTGTGHPTMVLDGFNNPGYSGGPVYVEGNGGLVPWAVISGYRYEVPSHASVFRTVAGMEEQVPDHYVKPNSGMIYAYSWGYVLDILKTLVTRNPPGPMA
jgi:hypothetical protein